jgi:hypothetical protein
VQLPRRPGSPTVAGHGVDHPQPGDVQHTSAPSIGRHKTWHWTHQSTPPKLHRMTTTQTQPTGQPTQPAGQPTQPGQPTQLVAAVRTALQTPASPAQTAQLVVDQLRRHLPSPDLLSPQQRAGSPHHHRSHTLHVEPDGSFSILALVWAARPAHPHPRPHHLVHLRRHPRRRARTTIRRRPQPHRRQPQPRRPRQRPRPARRHPPHPQHRPHHRHLNPHLRNRHNPRRHQRPPPLQPTPTTPNPPPPAPSPRQPDEEAN